MNLLHRRPLASVCLTFIVASIVTATLKFTYALLLWGLLLVLALFLFFRKRKTAALWGFMALIMLALALAVQLFAYVIPKERAKAMEGTPHLFEAKVTDTVPFDTGTFLNVRIKSADGEKKHIKAQMIVGKDAPRTGDLILFSGYISPLPEQTENAIFAMSEGIVAELDLTGQIEVLSHTFSVRYCFSELNRYFARQLHSVTAKESGGLYPALLLGNRAYLPPYATPVFRRAGASHLLALSGLHLTLLLTMLKSTCKKLKLQRRLTDFLCLGFLLFYTVLSGASASILRAAFMSGFYLLAWFCKRQNDSFTGLFLTGALLLLFSVGTVYDIGFWLSFFATFGIILAVRSAFLSRVDDCISAKLQGKMRKLLSPIRIFLHFLLIALFATLFTLPLSCLFFGRVSLFSLPASILLSPLAECILILAIPLLILSYIPFVGVWVGSVACLLTDALLAVAEWFGQASFGMVSLDFLPIRLLSVLLLVLLPLLPILSRKWIKPFGFFTLSVVCLCICLTALCNMVAKNQSHITYTEQSNQDYLLLADKKDICLVDISYGNSVSSGYALSLLNRFHVTYLNALVLTHLHSNHSSYLKGLAEDLAVGTLYVAKPMSQEELVNYDALLKTAKELHIRVVSFGQTETLFLASTSIRLWESFSLPQNSHSAFGLSLKREGQVLAVASADYSFLPLSHTASEDLLTAQTLILSAHGGIPKQFGILPICDAAKQLILPRKDLPFYHAEPVLSLLEQVEVVQTSTFTLDFE